MKVHHIGYLVEDIVTAMDVLLNVGYEIHQQPMHDGERECNIVFLKNGHTLVELISPGRNSQEYKTLMKRIGNGPYHICYVADDFIKDVRNLEENGWLMIKKPQSAVAIDGRKVAFFYHKSAGMIEILE